ncbi:TadE family protein [Streptomyces sp. NPDC096323]|uniref:TadE family protein n=1 Tax=Streptomyces sp. NPDC096323 TaxID=3155822 RepID=UPI0033344643
MATTERAETGIGRRRERRRDRDRGQTAIEFVGVTPLIILLLVALWQCALFGYTFILAGNAADVAARAGNLAKGNQRAACVQAAEKDLPSAWHDKADYDCPAAPGSALYEAKVTLTVPVLVPGVLDWGPKVTGEAASAREG